MNDAPLPRNVPTEPRSMYHVNGWSEVREWIRQRHLWKMYTERCQPHGHTWRARSTGAAFDCWTCGATRALSSDERKDRRRRAVEHQAFLQAQRAERQRASQPREQRGTSKKKGMSTGAKIATAWWFLG